jgi:hypothetical protein
MIFAARFDGRAVMFRHLQLQVRCQRQFAKKFNVALNARGMLAHESDKSLRGLGKK